MAYHKYEQTGDRVSLDEFSFNDWLDYVKAPELKTIPIFYVRGIYISSDVVEMRGVDDEDVKGIMSHDLFGNYLRESSVIYCRKCFTGVYYDKGVRKIHSTHDSVRRIINKNGMI